jgi:hypothetical protein
LIGSPIDLEDDARKSTTDFGVTALIRKTMQAERAFKDEDAMAESALQNWAQEDDHSGTHLRAPNVPDRAGTFGRNVQTLS